MTCQNLQNKLLNITVLFIWYLLQIVGEFKKNVTRQTWQALFHFGEYLFQSTRHFGECLKNMVSHTGIDRFLCIMHFGRHTGCWIEQNEEMVLRIILKTFLYSFNSNVHINFK